MTAKLAAGTGGVERLAAGTGGVERLAAGTGGVERLAAVTGGVGRLAAVTGGTGFVGRACAAALARDGWRVRILARRPADHPQLAGLPVDVVRGDLADGAALARLVQGADAVVHAAGLIRALRPADFLAVNRDGTGHLAGVVAREAPACRFVLVSSQAARAPELSPYAASKRDGERAVAAALGDTPLVVLRPGIVHGPFDAATRALLQLARLPVVPVPAAPEPRFSTIHVEDLARAVVALCAGGPAGVTFELNDGAPDGHAWRAIVRAAAGRVPRFVTVPDAVLLSAGAAAERWSRLVGRPSLFGVGKAREILHRDWRPDRGAAVPAALWQPRRTRLEFDAA